ncbi:MAG: hypothetical protein P1V20_21085 [Verrucomicrobiales bacterium]|nr:hypothetical protein [Verrucomicrobiales bacterium]
MNDLWDILRSLLMPMIGGLIGGFFVSWQAKKRIEKREFLDRVNFSLNMIKEEQLRFRTLLEKPGAEVFLNPEITKMVNRAAKLTTGDDSLLPIPKKDYWLCLNALLNEVSEKFASGFLKIDMDCSSCSTTYVMCLTCEVSDDIKTRKIRAMLMKKSLIENLPAQDPQVERPSHKVRVVTLRQLAAAYQDPARNHCFVEVELCV